MNTQKNGQTKRQAAQYRHDDCYNLADFLKETYYMQAMMSQMILNNEKRILNYY